MSRREPTREPDLRHVKPRDNRAVPKPREFPHLTEEDRAALKLVGSFRVVNVRDVPDAKVTRLVAKGVLQRRTLYPARGGKPYEVLTLTKKGLEYMRSQPDQQRYWAGVVKPRELEHDLMIYPAYQKEAEEIKAAAGSVKRVILDFELKSEINSKMNRQTGPERSIRQKEVADEYDLPIVNNHVALPDARIEYVDADGHSHHRDIEVTTRHYKGQHMAGRKTSGFRIHQAGYSGAAIRDDHRLTFV